VKIIVIGASAGGVPALREITSKLDADLDAAVFVVLHLGASAESNLHYVLQRGCALPVRRAEDRQPIRVGQVCVAPPDYHLVLEHGIVRLTRGPRENRARPSIDVLFRSAAYEYGPQVIGVVLSGALDDGSAGLWWIKNRGGTAIVQEPSDAEFPSMPESALSQVETDYVVPVGSIAKLCSQLSHREEAPITAPMSKTLDLENRIAKGENALQDGVTNLGPTTPYTCPDCGGVLIQVADVAVPQFRCHTGHAFSLLGLLEQLTENVESSIWGSLRMIEEDLMLLHQFSQHIRDTQHHSEDAAHLVVKTNVARRRADLLRRALHDDDDVQSMG
jgi:two-component system chemotaxis response regulator CheB